MQTKIYTSPIFIIATSVIIAISLSEAGDAQILNPSIRLPTLPELTPIPIQPFPLKSIPVKPTPFESSPESIKTITVHHFEVMGSSIFSQAEIDGATAEYLNKPITFNQLLKARDAITDLYVKNAYITTGAYIPEDQPPVSIEGGIVRINIIEGRVEDIRVVGNKRLNPNYIRSRIQLATMAPVNQERLVSGLRQLQLDPLFSNVSAELSAGNQIGSNVLEVKVTENKSFTSQVSTENNRSSSIGTWQRRIQATEGNLLGLGDSLTLAYTNTQGSNTIDGSYVIPISSHNTTLSFNAGTTSSTVIEKPFSKLDILSQSRYYEISLRQPIYQKVTDKKATEFTIGLAASRIEGQTSLLNTPFPLSVGADEQGQTRVSALRFFQEYSQRSNVGVLSFRSQFNLGLNLFNSTVNSNGPDSRFLSWKGQARWFHRLGDESALVIRGDIQIANRELLPLEQFGLGGANSLRGYRQDVLLSDNGAVSSVELQIPIIRLGKTLGVIQATPFIDIGRAWTNNAVNNLDQSTLLSTGLGFQWQAKNFSAKFDWGIPLIKTNSRKSNLQENGFYFTFRYNIF